MNLPFPDKFQELKEKARWYKNYSPEERFLDFVSLIKLLEDSVSGDPSLRVRQQAWINQQKNEIQQHFRNLSRPS